MRLTRLTRDRLADERGSSLMLWPTAVLIVLLLASIAFDFSVVLMGRRELRWAAEAAANDAATYGIDQTHYRRTNELRLAPQRVDDAVRSSLRARDAAIDLTGPPQVRIDTGGRVKVTLTARIPYLFADGFPGLPDAEIVTVTADATAIQSDS
jgi:Flp pilus assembly protein TadG